LGDVLICAIGLLIFAFWYWCFIVERSVCELLRNWRL